MTDQPIQPDSEALLQPDRLSQLEALAETTLLAVQQLAQQQGTLQQQLTSSVSNLIGMMTETRTDMLETRSDIREMQSEIRGLQTENRRILDVLQRHVDDGHGGRA